MHTIRRSTRTITYIVTSTTIGGALGTGAAFIIYDLFHPQDAFAVSSLLLDLRLLVDLIVLWTACIAISITRQHSSTFIVTVVLLVTSYFACARLLQTIRDHSRTVTLTNIASPALQDTILACLLLIPISLLCRAAIHRTKYWRRVMRPEQCAQCSYSLVGLPEAVCPECGNTTLPAPNSYRILQRACQIAVVLAIVAHAVVWPVAATSRDWSKSRSTPSTLATSDNAIPCHFVDPASLGARVVPTLGKAYDCSVFMDTTDPYRTLLVRSVTDNERNQLQVQLRSLQQPLFGVGYETCAYIELTRIEAANIRAETNCEALKQLVSTYISQHVINRSSGFVVQGVTELRR